MWWANVLQCPAAKGSCAAAVLLLRLLLLQCPAVLLLMRTSRVLVSSACASSMR